MPKDPNPADRAFHFEAQKAGFSESGNGIFLRLKLDPLDIPNALRSLAVGQRLFVVVTPMPDDLPPPSNEEVEEGERAVRLAGMLCKTPDFQAWIDPRLPEMKKPEETAANWLREKLGISSRAELKTNAQARRRLHEIHSQYWDAEGDTFGTG